INISLLWSETNKAVLGGTMTSRSQYLLFLVIWLTAIILILFVAAAAGVPIDTSELRGDFLVAGVIALAPAAGGFLLIRKARALVDAWRVRRGDDVFQQRAYEDDGGFIHLNAVPACEQEQTESVTEIVSGLGQAAESNDLTKDLK